MYEFPTHIPYNWTPLDQDGSQGRRWIVSGVMTVICSVLTYPDGKRWIHVSCARKTRIPDWDDLKHVKEIILGDRFAVQIFPPKDEYVNLHPFCLHLYSPEDQNYRPCPDFRIMGTI